MWKRDYLRHGIENAVRASLSDARLPRFWNGPGSDVAPLPPSPVPLRILPPRPLSGPAELPKP